MGTLQHEAPGSSFASLTARYAPRVLGKEGKQKVGTRDRDAKLCRTRAAWFTS